MGILTAFVNRWLQTLLLSVRASDIASELLLELSLPLLTFFLAEELHVSGIIAVVVSGILKPVALSTLPSLKRGWIL